MLTIGSDTRAPRVFVSYSHDSPEHMDRVLTLCDRLRREGIAVELDQYEPVPSESWPLWSARQVEQADFVLVICTETYRRRFDGTEDPGRGLGARWEAVAVAQAIHDAESMNRRFLPVLFHPANESHIPLVLRGTTRFLVASEEGYEQLYRFLTDQPESPRPVLGMLRPLPSKPRATDFPPPSAPPDRSRRRWLVGAAALASAFGICFVLVPFPVHEGSRAAAPSKVPAPLPSLVRGEILDAHGQRPLPGVEVQLPEHGFKQMTGESGQYRFEIPGPVVASIKVRALKAGYRTLNLDLPPGEHLNVHQMRRER